MEQNIAFALSLVTMTAALGAYVRERRQHATTRARLAKFGVKPKDAKGRFVKGEGA